MRAAIAAMLSLSLAPSVGASELRLDWPIDCTLGQDCFIQNHVDRDPTNGFADVTCGPLGYDGHKGTDIALPTLADMQSGVAVRAAAKGTVRGIRNDMTDVLMTSLDDPGIAGKECGNGVVIAHQGGWETQYCHMKRGSIAVKPGATIAAGTYLGDVGLSGATQFPHLHLSVRKDGTVVDPFAPETLTGCGEISDAQLWQPSVPYTPGGIIRVGFSPGLPEYEAIQAGTAATRIDADDPALVLWAYVYGARQGDVLTLDILGPDGVLLRTDVPLERTQAKLFRASGKRLTQSRWPAGPYNGTASLKRSGVEISRQLLQMTLPE